MTNTIIFVIDSLGDGGAEKVVLTLAEEFHNQGNQVHLITIKDHVVYDIPDGVIYHTMNFNKGLGFYRMVTDYRLKRRLVKKLKEIHRQTKIHAVFSHLIFSDTTLRKEKFDFPVLSTIHNTYSVRFLTNKRGLAKKFKCYKLQKIYNGKDIITVSKGVGDDLIQKIGIKPASLRVIYNPFNQEKIKEMAAEPLDIPYKDYIIHVGRFSPQKRHDILFKAFSKSKLDCNLVLLGAGSEEDRLNIKRLADDLNIADRLKMPGFTTNPYAWMRNARLFVMSSDFEGFPLVLVESLISGTPVISTDCPSGPSELLQNQPELLSPVGNVEALAKNMRIYYKTPPPIDENCTRNFSVETIVKQLNDAVESVQKL